MINILKKIRMERGFTQEKLAEEAEISVQYVRSIEGGYKNISNEVKKHLAIALKISIWILFPDIKREIDIYNLLISRYHKSLFIKETEIPIFKEKLSQISEDQFMKLISFNMTAIDVRQYIFAKEDKTS